MNRIKICIAFLVVVAVCYFVFSKTQTVISNGGEIQQQKEASQQAEVDAVIKGINIPR